MLDVCQSAVSFTMCNEGIRLQHCGPLVVEALSRDEDAVSPTGLNTAVMAASSTYQESAHFILFGSKNASFVFQGPTGP